MGQRYADDLESQNDEHLEGLTAKVKLLKDVSLTPLPTRVPLMYAECIDYHWHWQRGSRLDGPA